MADLAEPQVVALGASHDSEACANNWTGSQPLSREGGERHLQCGNSYQPPRWNANQSLPFISFPCFHRLHCLSMTSQPGACSKQAGTPYRCLTRAQQAA